MTQRRPSRIEYTLLRVWHALIFGGFTVAYVTGDEDTYSMHLFAGYVVLVLVGLRLVTHVAASSNSPLRLRRPSLVALAGWFRRPTGRSPLYAVMAAILLAVIGTAAASGAIADGVVWVEDFHEAVSEWSLPLVLGHAALVVLLIYGRRLWRHLSAKSLA